MRVLQTVLLGAALLVMAGGGPLCANTIFESSNPIPITGHGSYGWDYSDRSGGYEMWASGTNGVDTLSFRIYRYEPFGASGVELKTASGRMPGSPLNDGSLTINGTSYHQFNYYLGSWDGFIAVFDDDYNPLATIGVVGFFHQSSYWSGSPLGWPFSEPRLIEGTFRILPIAPVPEPGIGIVSALILAFLGIFGSRRKSATQ